MNIAKETRNQLIINLLESHINESNYFGSFMKKFENFIKK